MIYITATATYTLPSVYGLLVEINQPTTGIVTIADAGGTKAIIAASTAASGKRYYGFNGAVTITNASTENITVSVINNSGV